MYHGMSGRCILNFQNKLQKIYNIICYCRACIYCISYVVPSSLFLAHQLALGLCTAVATTEANMIDKKFGSVNFIHLKR